MSTQSWLMLNSALTIGSKFRTVATSLRLEYTASEKFNHRGQEVMQASLPVQHRGEHLYFEPETQMNRDEFLKSVDRMSAPALPTAAPKRANASRTLAAA